MELVAIRRVILAVLLLGMGGLLIELSLLAHYEDVKQWIPLAALAAGIFSVILQLVHPRVWTLMMVRFVMVLFIVCGLVGDVLSLPGQQRVPT